MGQDRRVVRRRLGGALEGVDGVLRLAHHRVGAAEQVERLRVLQPGVDRLRKRGDGKLRVPGRELRAGDQAHAVRVGRHAVHIPVGEVDRHLRLPQVRGRERLEIQRAGKALDDGAELRQLGLRIGILAGAHHQHRVEVGGAGVARLRREHGGHVRLRLRVLPAEDQHVRTVEPRRRRIGVRLDRGVDDRECAGLVVLRGQDLRLHQQAFDRLRIDRQRLVVLLLGGRGVLQRKREPGPGQQDLEVVRRGALGVREARRRARDVVQADLRHAAQHEVLGSGLRRRPLGRHLGQHIAEAALREVDLAELGDHRPTVGTQVARGLELLFCCDRVCKLHLQLRQVHVRVGAFGVRPHRVAVLDLRATEVALGHQRLRLLQRVVAAQEVVAHAPYQQQEQDPHGDRGEEELVLLHVWPMLSILASSPARSPAGSATSAVIPCVSSSV